MFVSNNFSVGMGEGEACKCFNKANQLESHHSIIGTHILKSQCTFVLHQYLKRELTVCIQFSEKIWDRGEGSCINLSRLLYNRKFIWIIKFMSVRIMTL